jgi:hypothetical protein
MINNYSICGYSLDNKDEISIFEGSKKECEEYAKKHKLKYEEI